MRIVFMGTPDFAVPTLRALDHAAHDIRAVYTQPPRPAGRGKRARPSPVAREAEVLGIETRTPASLKNADAQAALAALEPDAIVVAAYGLILPQAVLDIPPRGCLNVHASLLPRWRGAAPIHRAVMAGDHGTGVTIMAMEAGLDTGPMLATARTPIERKTTGELTDELAKLGAQLMVGTLRDLGVHAPIAQDEAEATYAPKIDKAEARIDWSRPAEEIERQVRGTGSVAGGVVRARWRSGEAFVRRCRGGGWRHRARCSTTSLPWLVAKARCGRCGCSRRASRR